jgi:hypothetical protein
VEISGRYVVLTRDDTNAEGQSDRALCMDGQVAWFSLRSIVRSPVTLEASEELQRFVCFVCMFASVQVD